MKMATKREVRDLYKSMGYEVVVSNTGKVQFRIPGEKVWRDGRWLSEYVVEDGEARLK